MADVTTNGYSDAARRRLREAARAAALLERAASRVTAPGRNVGFPYRTPTVPRGVEVPAEPPFLGADYDTEWARSPVARFARTVLSEGPLRLGVRGLAAPEIYGRDRLVDLARLEDPPPLIFTPNHHSHLDTMLMVRSVPLPWRRKLVVAAAADYFFDKRWKATLAALSLNAIPIDRESAGRKSATMIRELVDDGWSLVIYPEGGRSPDGWGQEFRGGAAYLSSRTGAPLVPVFIDGTGAIFGKGMSWPEPGRTRVVFGAPLHPEDGESTRRLNARIAAAVTALADEVTTDYWSARRRAATGENPALGGPEYTGWRRHWALSVRRRQGIAGWRTPPKRRWPEL
jgi:1-acyl-sn-glycerol-3-phosphate acyltransferase